jgi:hypothetical protein
MDEKRKNNRYKTPDIPVKVRFSFSGKVMETGAKVKDISKGGVFLSLDGMLLKGTKCELVFKDMPVSCVVTETKKQQRGCGLKIVSEGKTKGDFEMFVDILRREADSPELREEQKPAKAPAVNIRKKSILYIASEDYGFGTYVSNRKLDAIYDFVKLTTESEARAALLTGNIVLIVIDTRPTPSLGGIRLLENLKKSGLDLTNIPIIFVGTPLSQQEIDSAEYMGITFERLDAGQANPAGLRSKINKLLYR